MVHQFVYVGVTSARRAVRTSDGNCRKHARIFFTYIKKRHVYTNVGHWGLVLSHEILTPCAPHVQLNFGAPGQSCSHTWLSGTPHVIARSEIHTRDCTAFI